jgi:hypothetical protein
VDGGAGFGVAGAGCAGADADGGAGFGVPEPRGGSAPAGVLAGDGAGFGGAGCAAGFASPPAATPGPGFGEAPPGPGFGGLAPLGDDGVGLPVAGRPDVVTVLREPGPGVTVLCAAEPDRLAAGSGAAFVSEEAEVEGAAAAGPGFGRLRLAAGRLRFGTLMSASHAGPRP